MAMPKRIVKQLTRFIIKSESLRAGFTLLDTLAAMAIASLIGGIAIGAIQYSREAARRITCSNNMRQIGFGLNLFLETHGRYPGAFCGIVDRPPAVPRQYCFSVHAKILDQLGFDAIADAIEWNDSASDSLGSPPIAGDNSTAVFTRISIFICPSDSFEPGTLGATNYRFNKGILPISGRDPLGVFIGYSGIAPARVTDGLSHTAAASESINYSGSTPRSPRKVPPSASGVPLDCFSNSISSLSSDPYWGTSYLRGSSRMTLYYHLLRPNPDLPDCFWDPGGDSYASARSQHIDGVNVLKLDGSVNFVKNSIEISIWRALATRDSDDLHKE